MKKYMFLFILTIPFSSQSFSQEMIQGIEIKGEKCPSEQVSNTISTNNLKIPSRIENASVVEAYTSQMRAGGWSGNGGDFGEVSDNIWFLGSKSVSYCIESSENYLLAREELKGLVSSSIEKWKNFFQKYNLTGNLGGNIRRMGRRGLNASINFLDGVERGANFNLSLSNDCNVSDLKFFFGVENKIIKDYKKYATEHPFGFAIRKSYDHKKYQNSGIVWIKNITESEKIEHTLLHELGHVFGMKHDSVYIMRASMAIDLETEKKNNTINEIESKAWPYRFIKNSSLKLKTLKGKKRPGAFCQSKDSFMVGREAKAFSSIIKMNPSDCLNIEVKSLGDFGAKKVQFELIVNNLTSNKTVTLQGIFQSKRKVLAKKKGPGVFSQYHVSNPRRDKVVWRKLSLDKSENYELSGSFRLRNKIIPAKLVQDKGAILDLFFPRNNKWITLKSYSVD